MSNQKDFDKKVEKFMEIINKRSNPADPSKAPDRGAY